VHQQDIPAHNLAVAQAIFGNEGAAFLSILDQVVGAIPDYRYHFSTTLHPDGLSSDALVAHQHAQQVYWQEMVMRLHMTSLTSLMRAARWATGMVSETDNANYLAFAACTRGLIESTADSWLALRVATPTFVKWHPEIRRILRGNVPINAALVSTEAEEALIHYSHARHVERGEDAPASHTKKPVREYLKSLADTEETAPMTDCYAELCELAHPAAASVFVFLDVEDELGESLLLRQHGDYADIHRFCEEYRPILRLLLDLSLNPPLVALKLINLLEYGDYATAVLEVYDLSALPRWQKIDAAIHRPPIAPWQG
jgi:hypothetical protein